MGRDHSLTRLSGGAVDGGDPVVDISIGQSTTILKSGMLLANLLREPNKCAVHTIRLSCTTGTISPRSLVMEGAISTLFTSRQQFGFPLFSCIQIQKPLHTLYLAQRIECHFLAGCVVCTCDTDRLCINSVCASAH